MQHRNEDIAMKIMDLLKKRDVTSSICPSEVARALESDEQAWRALMPHVRAVAADLQDKGDVLITRGSDSVDRNTLDHGPIRIRRKV